MYTPPRSIRLDDQTYSNTNQFEPESDEDLPEKTVNGGTPHAIPKNVDVQRHGPGGGHSTSFSRENSFVGRGPGAGGAEVAVRENMTPFEELQLVRRQIAKLNHRLMAVELENQQQQQREMIFTILVTAYFFGKFVMWVNRNT